MFALKHSREAGSGGADEDKQDGEVLLAVEAGRRVCWDSPVVSENCHSSFFQNGLTYA